MEFKRKRNGGKRPPIPPFIPTGRKRGAPKLADRVYHDGMCGIVRRLGSQGKTEAQFAAHFGVRRSTMRGWAKTHANFKEALADANDFSLAWWEDKGHRSLTRSGFNTGLYNKIISCRFRHEYSDHLVVGGDPDAPIITKIVRVIKRPGDGASNQ